MNYFALGFGAVALMVVGAVDYTNQAAAAGQAPGSFPVSAYFATYGQRIAGQPDMPEPAGMEEAGIVAAPAQPPAPAQMAEAEIAPAALPDSAEIRTEDAQPSPPPPPARLQLSGGTTCLEGSAGRFCRD